MRDISRKKPCLKNRVDIEIEQTLIKLAIQNPAFGQVRASNELKKQGILVSPGGVRSVWLRNDLETFKKRLVALERQSAEKGLILTEAQLRAMEKAKEEKAAHGEIETQTPRVFRCSGHLLCGNTKRGRAHLPTDIY